MVALRDIRNRIQSVKNIQQITSTMERVASTRLRKAQTHAKESQPYAEKLAEILEKLATASTDFSHPLFEQREIKKIGLMVVAADKGLAGPYNHNIFSAADKFLKANSHTQLILLGRKAMHYYQPKAYPICHKWLDWSGKMAFSRIKELSDQLVADFLSEELDAIWFLYTKFHSALRREVVLEPFLPIKPPQSDKKSPSLNYLFEPTAEEIYASILPRYCLTKIQSVLNNAYASELIARMFAMRNAAKNAGDMVENLTLLRNKVRQASITKEMLEIVAGAAE